VASYRTRGTVWGVSGNSYLIARLEALPPIAGLRDGVAAALGRTVEQLADPELTVVLGSHALLNDELLAVYVVTDRVLAVFEATPDGRSFALSVPTTRIRRVARYEDQASTRVTLEIDADRSSVRGTLNEAAFEGSLVPAGYEISESDPERRELLRAFHRAAAAAAGL
jgi:hypothetical protein